VRLERETSMHYFSCSVGPGADSKKKCIRTHYVELLFLHLVRSAAHVVHSGASGHELPAHYFSCSGGPGVEPT
jgi:hypothetical protein